MDYTLQSMPFLAQPQDSHSGATLRWLVRMFFHTAEVAENQPIAAGMHRITLHSPALRGLHWQPGDKLQVRVGPGLLTRTYTPVHWDAVRGSTQILAHALAAGPGSEWVRRASPGQTVTLSAPRRSMPLSATEPRLGVLVGDETALGLAALWRPSHSIIEAGNQPAIQAMVDSLGLQARAVAMQPGGLHLDAITHAMLGLCAADTHFVLAGRARTVKYLRLALRGHGIRPHRIRSKAFWADGNTGLD